jgi:hypothetical protein
LNPRTSKFRESPASSPFPEPTPSAIDAARQALDAWVHEDTANPPAPNNNVTASPAAFDIVRIRFSSCRAADESASRHPACKCESEESRCPPVFRREVALARAAA